MVSADDPFVTPDERCERRGQVTVERDEVAGVEGPVRLLLTPLPDGRILAVGASLEERDEALAGLLGELFLIGPVALLLGVASRVRNRNGRASSGGRDA